MLLLSQIREELALYFELIGQPKTAAEKAIRDRIVNLHNELVKIEVVAAVVPIADLQAVVRAYDAPENPDDVPPASFLATIKAVEALIESRTPKPKTEAPESKQTAAVEPPATESPAPDAN